MSEPTHARWWRRYYDDARDAGLSDEEAKAEADAKFAERAEEEDEENE